MDQDTELDLCTSMDVACRRLRPPPEPDRSWVRYTYMRSAEVVELHLHSGLLLRISPGASGLTVEAMNGDCSLRLAQSKEDPREFSLACKLKGLLDDSRATRPSECCHEWLHVYDVRYRYKCSECGALGYLRPKSRSLKVQPYICSHSGCKNVAVYAGPDNLRYCRDHHPAKLLKD